MHWKSVSQAKQMWQKSGSNVVLHERDRRNYSAFNDDETMRGHVLKFFALSLSGALTVELVTHNLNFESSCGLQRVTNFKWDKTGHRFDWHRPLMAAVLSTVNRRFAQQCLNGMLRDSCYTECVSKHEWAGHHFSVCSKCEQVWVNARKRSLTRVNARWWSRFHLTNE